MPEHPLPALARQEIKNELVFCRILFYSSFYEETYVLFVCFSTNYHPSKNNILYSLVKNTKSLTTGSRSLNGFQGMGVMEVIKQPKIFVNKCMIGLDRVFCLLCREPLCFLTRRNAETRAPA